MSKRLFLLDGMALAYRAHFALATRPIYTSKGVNSSALFGFTQTLLEIIKNAKPTHMAVAFDTDVPTHRHKEFSDYKIQREAMPEDLSLALPHVRRMVEAFNLPVIISDGWEADDIIGTIVKRAEKEGFESFMVTPDKDFAQLVSDKSFLYKPSRMGEGIDIWGAEKVREKWGVEPVQVIDILGLWGDASDNIPGVPGIGEKTACKLVSQYGSIENLLMHTAELKGKLKESLEQFREQALLSKRLATICTEVPLELNWDCLKIQDPRNDAVKKLCHEFEFNSIGRRIFGDDFRAGPTQVAVGRTPPEEEVVVEAAAPEPAGPRLTLADLKVNYRRGASPTEWQRTLDQVRTSRMFSFSLVVSNGDPWQPQIQGVAIGLGNHNAWFQPWTDPTKAGSAAAIFSELIADPSVTKVAHDLKMQLRYLRSVGLKARGPLFDTLIAHSLLEPEMKHHLSYVSEVFLNYSPLKTEPTSGQMSLNMGLDDGQIDVALESADLAWRLKEVFEPLLKSKKQEKVFYEIEGPLIAVLVEMEHEGIRIDSHSLNEFATQLTKEMAEQEKAIYLLAGKNFNLNSPRQLGEVLFEDLKLLEKPKKTKTGQYSTDEPTLAALATDHEIVSRLLDYRAATKLKSTYADALPLAVSPKSGRIHTTFLQAVTTTGRLNSQNPNIQNIPIRTERGKEIRRAFVPRDKEYALLSADYSQIELRIIASLSHEETMIEAFRQNLDIHTATAARVYGVGLDGVTSEMRRKAKMVNYGIAYGISAFGLAQRLGIPRKEASTIIDQYFQQFPGIRKFMSDTIEFCRKTGYVETVTGRRRYLRDITSSNAMVRGSAERNAINAPIQGTAADMIKLAMVNIFAELEKLALKSRLLLQVHDELVFDLYRPEEAQLRALVADKMGNALSLEVPIEVEIGVGENWLEAH